MDTVTAGRSKRSTAGNRMRELLEKAHQEDEDELFAEVEDDEEFEAPKDQRDVYLEDFADTDDEVEEGEEDEEKRLRREERRRLKGKARAPYNPLQPRKKARFDPSVEAAARAAAQYSKFDTSIDPTTMAPSTLVLALRAKKREAKRMNRSETRRSTMRASTLRTEDEIKARHEDLKANRGRKGRKAQHEGGEVRGKRHMTQDELIAAALEEEERNRASLRDWVRREEERRELRRVGRKRVKGPRWTFVSRTVGKVVEVVDDGGASAQTAPTVTALPTPGHAQAGPAPTPALPTTDDPAAYARNYLILSSIPGGLASEISLIMGAHADWSEMQYIPARNRPINRRPALCPLTGQVARYKHPVADVPYTEKDGYAMVQGVIGERMRWGDGWWGDFEEGLIIPEINGGGGSAVGGDDGGMGDELAWKWREKLAGGWMGGKEILEEEQMKEDYVVEEIPVEQTAGLRKARKSVGAELEDGDTAGLADAPKAKKGKKGKK